MSGKNLVIGIAVLLAVLAALSSYLFVRQAPVPVVQTPPPAPAKPAVSASESLGAKIYESAQNPIEGKVPTANPVGDTNPIKSIYKNPFE